MINDGAFWEGMLSRKRLLGRGLLYSVYVPSFVLANLASRNIGFVNNPEESVYVLEIALIIAGGVEHKLELFNGGTISGGSSVSQTRVNRVTSAPEPFLLVLDDATIDTPGTLIAESLVTDRPISGFQDGVFIGPVNETNYITITNNSGVQADFIDLYVSAARMT